MPKKSHYVIYFILMQSILTILPPTSKFNSPVYFHFTNYPYSFLMYISLLYFLLEIYFKILNHFAQNLLFYYKFTKQAFSF